MEQGTFEIGSWTGKTVEVSLVDGSKKNGILYCMNPNDGSLIILKSDSDFDSKSGNNDQTADFIVQNITSYSSIQLIKDEERFNCETLDHLFHPAFNSGDQTVGKNVNLEDKLDKLVQHFTANRIPHQVSSEGVVSAVDVVKIHPPYDTQSCSSFNEIVLGRIQKIVTNFNQSYHNISSPTQ